MQSNMAHAWTKMNLDLCDRAAAGVGWEIINRSDPNDLLDGLMDKENRR